MDSEKIILTKEIFRVLASETRITLLKKLAQRRMTISELSRELNLAKSTVHEHLLMMTAAGLIAPVPDDHTWKYYEITRKGENLLMPENSATVVFLLSSTIFLCIVGAVAAFVMAWISRSREISQVPVHGAGLSGNSTPEILFAVIGVILFTVAILILIRLYKVRAAIRSEGKTVS